MWWAGDWMACSQSLQSLRVSSCASERGLNNVEYTFGNKIIVTCLTDNNPVLITTHSSLPHIMKGAHCGDRGVSGFIWNGIWNRHCQVLLAPLHDEMEFLENVSVSQCLPILDNFDILSSSLVISFQYPALILLNNVFVIQNFLSNPESCLVSLNTRRRVLFVIIIPNFPNNRNIQGSNWMKLFDGKRKKHSSHS